MPIDLIDVQADGLFSAVEEAGLPTVPPAAQAAVARMRQYAEQSGLGLLCVDSRTGMVLGRSAPDLLPLLPADIRRQLGKVAGPRVVASSSGLLFGLLPLPDMAGARAVAVGFVLSDPSARPRELILAAAEENWPQARLDRWLADPPHASPQVLQRLLELAVAQTEQEGRSAGLEREIDQLSDEIDQTYEEITLLHRLTQNLQISRSPAEVAEVCLDRIHELLRADGNLIWIEERDGTPYFLVRGTLPFDEIGLARLLSCCEEHDWSRPLVKNYLDGTLLGTDFPGLQNLVIVPIAEGPHRSGWIASCNPSDGREFGTVEASLLNSVASILGTHNRNIDLYQQHEELLLSFVRSLVSTLDAKDPYTRGHSERVALIARRLGEEMGLPEEELQDIYLAGLLHDIGKIGVDDRILRKPGALTDEEFAQIQQHPMIGYNILKGLKNLQKVLPGVRNHHETWSGKGYPDRLRGEESPLMARILAVADSYDAMGSDRPYRNGMPLEKLEDIFRRGAGDQWDARVIEAYFVARDAVRGICETYTPTAGNLLPDAADGAA